MQASNLLLLAVGFAAIAFHFFIDRWAAAIAHFFARGAFAPWSESFHTGNATWHERT
jgi:hypothetical protein